MPKQKEREAQKDIPLSKGERAELLGLQAREREIQREIIAPLQEDYLDFVRKIEAQHGVEIGKDYGLNPMTFELFPIVPEASTEAN